MQNFTEKYGPGPEFVVQWLTYLVPIPLFVWPLSWDTAHHGDKGTSCSLQLCGASWRLSGLLKLLPFIFTLLNTLKPLTK